MAKSNAEIRRTNAEARRMRNPVSESSVKSVVAKSGRMPAINTYRHGLRRKRTLIEIRYQYLLVACCRSQKRSWLFGVETNFRKAVSSGGKVRLSRHLWISAWPSANVIPLAPL